MDKVVIELNNNKFKISGPLKILNNIDKAFAIRNPNAFHIRRYMGKGWDGKQHYLTESGYMKTGLFPNLISYLETNNIKYQIDDYRFKLEQGIIPDKIGDNTPRDYQVKAIESIINNEVGGIHFPMGVINAATNAGKTTIAAGIYLAYQRNLNALILVNDGDLYNQFLEELPKLVGQEDFGYVRGKTVKWGKFTLGMVQSISQNIQRFQYELSKFQICLVDEADLADNKTYKKVIEKLYNSNIRVGLSGTIYMSKLAKDKLKNENLRCFFSNEVFKITKEEMIKKGHSTNIVIKIVQGNTQEVKGLDFKSEYNQLIVHNNDRHLKSLDRAIFNIKHGRIPMLIVCQFHEHIDNLYKVYKDKLGDKYSIEKVYHTTKDRKEIFARFRKGEINILISSFIVKRGKNFPLLRYLQNASGSDSNETISQLMGRLERKHESKKLAYMDDLFDEGRYLKRHSKHRINYYRKEKLKVINLINKSNGRKKKK